VVAPAQVFRTVAVPALEMSPFTVTHLLEMSCGESETVAPLNAPVSDALGVRSMALGAEGSSGESLQAMVRERMAGAASAAHTRRRTDASRPKGCCMARGERGSVRRLDWPGAGLALASKLCVAGFRRVCLCRWSSRDLAITPLFESATTISRGTASKSRFSRMPNRPNHTTTGVTEKGPAGR